MQIQDIALSIRLVLFQKMVYISLCEQVSKNSAISTANAIIISLEIYHSPFSGSNFPLPHSSQEKAPANELCLPLGHSSQNEPWESVYEPAGQGGPHAV